MLVGNVSNCNQIGTGEIIRRTDSIIRQTVGLVPRIEMEVLNTDMGVLGLVDTGSAVWVMLGILVYPLGLPSIPSGVKIPRINGQGEPVTPRGFTILKNLGIVQLNI